MSVKLVQKNFSENMFINLETTDRQSSYFKKYANRFDIDQTIIINQKKPQTLELFIFL